MQAKQERFEREFARLQFTFDAASLHLPTTSASSNDDALLEEEATGMGREADELGAALGDIYDILTGNLKAKFRQEGAVIETN